MIRLALLDDHAAVLAGLRRFLDSDRGLTVLAAAPDPAILQEISMNLERVRLSEATPDSDFEGRILLTVETDPFEILFMGEYEFASCLSLRGSNA